ncbi:aminotransferase class V-fold PLP-dependent enzyme [Roseibacillus ishigakijimensis]|uniref:Cysteine desulfurase n=1 Tax=Roseibacillus ishigakijimensis TaxID=454146 RepID=A0A934RSZ1_9BACT|nr:cysteine desulfurase [Roseibacillus ishigakijimensis]MBK1835091.1 cysteine desulfurase [Roseibacillus ishigakijimensis]
MSFDPLSIRDQFPILASEVHGQLLVYLDNAATVQKPRAVLDCSRNYYESLNANIHRGTHHLSQRATAAHEAARETVAHHLHAASSDEIIFTSGTTDGINLVAHILTSSLQEGDEILFSGLEHHSNIVPWQMLAERTGAVLRVIPVLDDGTLDEDAYHALLCPRTRLVALTQISNAFGTPVPLEKFLPAARELGALTLVDGAQGIAHQAVDLQALDCDFYVFSGHKVYAPTGIGVLYGKSHTLEALPPWRGGGEMIKEVTYEKSTYNDLPFRYEAGTPNIEGSIALAAALDWLHELDFPALAAHEQNLIEAAARGLREIEGLTFYGPANRVGSLSFTIAGVHPYDLGTLVDQMGVAVRTGHHCCQPLMGRFGITGTVRASFAAYNTHAEVDALVAAVKKAALMLR